MSLPTANRARNETALNALNKAKSDINNAIAMGEYGVTLDLVDDDTRESLKKELISLGYNVDEASKPPFGDPSLIVDWLPAYVD